VASFYACAFPAFAKAQAAVEYAAKAASGALSKTGEIRLGICHLDSAVASCIHRYYPREFYFGVFMAGVFVAMVIFKRRS
jgi:hypothetical protein